MVIWKYNKNGKLDTAFGKDGFVKYNRGHVDDEGLRIALDNNRNIYVVGYSTNISSIKEMTIWKYNSNGELDTTFGNGNGFVAHSIRNYDTEGLGISFGKDKSDGTLRIYVAGYTLNGNKQGMVIWKYKINGDLDTSFVDSNNSINRGFLVYHGANYAKGMALALEKDKNGVVKSIYVTGYSNNGSGNDMVVWKYDDKGALDTTFGSGNGFVTYNRGVYAKSEGNFIALDKSGNIYVAGGYSFSSLSNVMVVWKYTSKGELDTSFGHGRGYISYFKKESKGVDMAFDNDGNIYIAGYSNNRPNDYMTIWKYDSNGDLDTAFGNRGGFVTHNSVSKGKAIVLDSSGNIYVAGYSHETSNDNATIWKYDKNGKQSKVTIREFGKNGVVVQKGNLLSKEKNKDAGNGIVCDIYGNIYVAGYSYNGKNYDMTIWKYTSNGKLDEAFGDLVNPSKLQGYRKGFVTHDSATGGGRDDKGNAIALDNSGNIYVAGYSNNGLEMVL